MENLINKLVENANIIITDSLKDTKAAHARIRKATLEIAKIGKEYRKVSIEADKK